MSRKHDRELGMDRSITRRDFINGVSVAVTGSVLGANWLSCAGVPDPAPETAPGQIRPGPAFAPEKDPGYYPPSLTGMRGSHPGSFEAAHGLRDGQSLEASGATESTNDLPASPASAPARASSNRSTQPLVSQARSPAESPVTGSRTEMIALKSAGFAARWGNKRSTRSAAASASEPT